MILYYSNSGNTAFVAKTIAEVLGEDPKDIRENIKAGVKHVYSETPFIICAPVYRMNLPSELEDYINDLHFVGTRDVALVLTASFSAGNAKGRLVKSLRAKGLKVGLVNVFYPPTSNILGLTYPKQESAQKTFERMRAEVVHYAELFKKVQPIVGVGSSLFGVFGTLIGRALPKCDDKKFFATDECISCGKCADTCHLNNIEIKDGKPCFLGNCDHCSACVNVCPKDALQYGKRTLGRERRRLEFVPSKPDVFDDIDPTPQSVDDTAETEKASE